MKSRVHSLCLLFLIGYFFLPLTLSAQRGSRAVFGIGLAPVATTFQTNSGTNFGLGVGLKAGLKVSDQTDIYFSTLLSPVGRKFLGGTFYGVAGLAVRYFVQNQVGGMFLTAGGDIGFWDIAGESAIIPNFDYGLGPHGGIGYAFTDHWIAEGTFSWIYGQGNSVNVFSLWLAVNYEI
jgi:hypothetical protein